MNRNFLANTVAYFFVLLFLYTGAEKFIDFHAFKEQLISSPFLSSMAGFVAWGLPIGEIVLAIALVVPAWQLKGLYATLGLMTFFTGYVVVILFIDKHLSCSCGGIIEELSPKQHVLFNSICVILSLAGIVVTKRQYPSVRFKWLSTTSVLCLFLLIGWTIFTAFKSPGPIKTGLEGRLLPSFNLQLPDSVTQLNTANIPTGKPIVMIGFSPFCTHCQQETRDIIKHIQKFRDIQIYFVTPYGFRDMKNYYSFFKLAQYPNIKMGVDSSDYFLKYFKAWGVPYTAVYDSNKRLKQVMSGQADVVLISKIAAE